MVPAAVKAMEADGQRDASRFDTILARLRATQYEHDEQEESAGRRAGSHWAENQATAPEIRRLGQARDPWGNDWYFGVGSSVYPDAERFFFIIRPASDGDRSLAQAFWEGITGNQETPETAYVQGFAVGAMEIWHEFEDKI